MQRQKIRPSYAELKRLHDGDIDDGESDSDTPEYAPAAIPYRRTPPDVLASGEIISSRASTNDLERVVTDSGKNSDILEKVVRIAESSQNQIHQIESYNQNSVSRRSNSQLSTNGLRFDNVKEQESSLSAPQTDLTGSEPLIGTIQERSGIVKDTNASEGKKLSRFASARQKDRQVVDSTRDLQSNNDSTEIWLDEERQAMSAFRKNRLISLGKKPPATRNIENAGDAQYTNGAPFRPNNEMESTSNKSVSDENDAKIAAMSVNEIEDSLQQLKETFGADLLEKLKKRKKVGESKSGDKISGDDSMTAFVKGRKPGEAIVAESTEELRLKYFPNESRELPSSLQWTQELKEESNLDTGEILHRFDFSGSLIPSDDDTTSDSHLKGLHHHGQEQHRAGYTIDELLHLARSTLPSQSILALQTLERIVSRYPEHGELLDSDVNEVVSQYITRQKVRGKTAVIASWFLENRQISLRRAANRCLQACLTTTLAGPDPTFGVVNTLASPKSEDKASYDINSEDLALALVPSLCSILSQHQQTQDDVDIPLSILVLLCKKSVKTCNAVIRHRSAISSIVLPCIVQPTWPPLKKDKVPKADALTLLLCLISSSRQNAAVLVEEGLIDSLLRFIALPPWRVPTIEDNVSIWKYYDSTMQIYNALAAYGMYTNVVKTAHSLMLQVADWISKGGKDCEVNADELSALSSTLQCIDTWTICATDPHQIVGPHDIGWSQVSEWGDCALTCLERACQEALQDCDQRLMYFIVAAESLQVLQDWIDCATRYKQISKDDLLRYVSKAESSISSIMTILNQAIIMTKSELSSCISAGKAKLSWLDALPKLKQLSKLCKSAEIIISFSKKRSSSSAGSNLSVLIDTARKLVACDFWPSLDDKDARHAGSDLFRQDIVAFCYSSLFTDNDHLRVEKRLLEVLSMMQFIRHGQEYILQEVIEKVLPRLVDNSRLSDLLILKPFYAELIRSKRKMQNRRPRFISPKSLLKTQTLFFNVVETDSNNDDENVDPLSGASLWKCFNSGLPLRLDWPFAALDDLLHSGNCASLNRKDALDSDWDANERQIVISSLQVGAALWQQALKQRFPNENLDKVLPSIAEVHLAIIKVFLLEEQQDQANKGTGLITGKDLFRDTKIISLLEELFEIARNLPLKDEEDMEKVAKKQFGPSLAFFQMYTSLMGLYDSISFGMDLFSRAILLAQTNQYASDYRRLLWIDYAHCLTSIQVTLKDNPYVDLQSYLIVGTNKEFDIIQSMSQALVTKSISKEKNELIWHIAIQQIAHILWYDELIDDSSKKRVAKSISTSDLGEVKEAIIDYFHSDDQKGLKKQEVTQERRQWLDRVNLPS